MLTSSSKRRSATGSLTPAVAASPLDHLVRSRQRFLLQPVIPTLRRQRLTYLPPCRRHLQQLTTALDTVTHNCRHRTHESYLCGILYFPSKDLMQDTVARWWIIHEIARRATVAPRNLLYTSNTTMEQSMLSLGVVMWQAALMPTRLRAPWSSVNELSQCTNGFSFIEPPTPRYAKSCNQIHSCQWPTANRSPSSSASRAYPLSRRRGQLASPVAPRSRPSALFSVPALR